MKIKKRLLIVGILIIIGITVFLINRFSNRHDETVLILSGNMEVTEIDIGFKISGRVLDLFAEEGQKVKKREALAILPVEP